MKPVSFIFILIATWCSYVRAENPLTGFIEKATTFVIDESGLPPIPSEHHSIAVSEIHDPKVEAVLNRLNLLFPEHSKIKFTQAPVHNVMMDTQRKLIISGPESFIRFTEGQDLAIAVLLAHEMGHYLHKVYTSMKALPDHFYQGIPEEDLEHAWVEGFSCEILRRAGYTRVEIQQGYDVMLGSMERAFQRLAQIAASQGAVIMPVTDVQSRRSSIRQYFTP